MAHRIDKKQAAREARVRAEEEARRTAQRQKVMRYAGAGIVAAIAAVLVVVAIGLNGSGALGAHSGATSKGPAIGAQAPDFSLTDVVSGKQMTLAQLRGHKTLMFFSEGVSCAPCLEQAADLQKSGLLAKAGVQLVSVTTDQPSDLAAAAQQYGITTPILADPSTSMSVAYGMLSHGGMQMPGQDGHAFMLLGPDGKVLWHQAYQSMYVAPNQLMADMNAGATGGATGMGALGS
jgi:peroxiredoxin Q/BCP